jgi:hypothetical protein
VSPVKYELGFYIPEDDILHSHRRENLKSYITSTSLPPESNYHLLLIPKHTNCATFADEMLAVLYVMVNLYKKR